MSAVAAFAAPYFARSRFMIEAVSCRESVEENALSELRKEKRMRMTTTKAYIGGVYTL